MSWSGVRALTIKIINNNIHYYNYRITYIIIIIVYMQLLYNYCVTYNSDKH